MYLQVGNLLSRVYKQYLPQKRCSYSVVDWQLIQGQLMHHLLHPLRETRVCAGVTTVFALLKLGTGSAAESKAWFFYITRQVVVCEKFLVHQLALSGGLQ